MLLLLTVMGTISSTFAGIIPTATILLPIVAEMVYLLFHVIKIPFTYLVRLLTYGAFQQMNKPMRSMCLVHRIFVIGMADQSGKR